MRHGISITILLAATLSVAGCSGDGSGGEAPPTNELSGLCTMVVSGTEDGVDFLRDGSLDLTATGSVVEGTWVIGEGTAEESSGTISGIIDGLTLTFTMTQLVPCDGTFIGSGMFSLTNQAQGGYSGSSCNGDVDATFMSISCTQL